MSVLEQPQVTELGGFATSHPALASAQRSNQQQSFLVQFSLPL